MKRITIAMSDELSELVMREARRRGVSVSAWIRDAVREAIFGTESSPREIPFAGIFHDPRMTPGRDVDEALEETWADDADRRS